MTEKLLLLEDVCELVRLGPDAVRRAVKNGDLVASKLGGRLRFRPEAVDVYVDSLQVKATPVQPRSERSTGALPPAPAPRSRKRGGSMAELVEQARIRQGRPA